MNGNQLYQLVMVGWTVKKYKLKMRRVEQWRIENGCNRIIREADL